MSRSGYSDDYNENYALWRAAVDRAIGGKRGQLALRDLAVALDAMPEKRLAANSFSRDGEVCTLGALARHRAIDVSDLEPAGYEPEDFESIDASAVGKRFDIAWSMAAEIMYLNDEYGRHDETDEQRWQRMREWVEQSIEADAA